MTQAKAEPSAGGLGEQRYEETLIALFDVETTVPSGSGRGSGYFLLEFGAILVCPRRLVEVETFSTLIRPSDLNAISPFSIRCNGITRDSVTKAPSFADVADKVYSILHGRVWAGHNILNFDCARIREAFAEIGRSPPEPMGTIDTLPLLTQKFGRRAGNMKMATLASYFGLGPQKHRSLDDVRLNLEVLKHCATVLFLESSVSYASSIRSMTTESTIAKNCNNQDGISVIDLEGSSCLNSYAEELSDNLDQSDHPFLNDDIVCSTSYAEQMDIDSSQLNLFASAEKKIALDFVDATSYNGTIKKLSSHDGFLEPNNVLVQHITVGHSNLSLTVKKMHILHINVPLLLCGRDLVIQFGISTKFTDYAGRPKLSILVNAPDPLCRILYACESLVQNSLRSCGSTSNWTSLIKKNDFTNSSNIRIHIQSSKSGSANNESGIYSTEIYRKEASGNTSQLVFNKFDATELNLLLAPGTTIDGFLSFDVYNYRQNAGIKLLAECLVVHSG